MNGDGSRKIMDKTERFYRRKTIIDMMPIILSEATYHRNNEEEEKLPGVSLWRWDDEHGEADLS